MNLAAVTEKIPIETDKDGVIRVGNTRVTLETLVSAFNSGLTAEMWVFPARMMQPFWNGQLKKIVSLSTVER